MEALINIQRDAERRRRLFRYQNNLWALMTEIGGIKVVPNLISRKDGNRLPLLSEAFHKPILAEWDALRQRREKNELDRVTISAYGLESSARPSA